MAISTIARLSGFPLSDFQRQVWLVEEASPGGSLYNEVAAFRVAAPADPDRLSAALEQVLTRNEVFRSRVVPGAEPHVEIASVSRPVVEVLLSDGLDVEHLAAEFAERPYSLDDGPLVRFAVIPVGAREHVLLVGMHHLISDGTSLRLLLRDLDRAYDGGVLEAAPARYAEFAGWLADHQVSPDGLAYWAQALRNARTTLELSGRPRSGAKADAGRQVHVPLPSAAAAAVDRLARDHAASPMMVLMAAFAAVAAARAGQDDIILGTAADTRGRRFRDTCGLFANLLPIRLTAPATLPFGELVSRVRDRMLAAMEHRFVSFERIVELADPPRKASRTPLVQVVFSSSQATPHRTLGGRPIERIDVPRGRSRFDLLVEFETPLAGPRLTAEYDIALFDEATVIDLLRACLRLVVAAAEQPAASLAFVLPGIRPVTPAAPPASTGPGQVTRRQEQIAGQVAEIWRAVLGTTADIPLDSDFFLHGGTSMATTRVRKAIADEFGVRLPMRVMFDDLTPLHLAARIIAAQPAHAPADSETTGASRVLPLTHAQLDIWLHEKINPSDLRFNIPLAIDLSGPLDTDRLIAALRDTVAAQPVLRSTFPLTPGGPAMRLSTQSLEVILHSAADSAAFEAGQATRSFDLDAEIPIRAFLIDRLDGRHTLLLLLHHIAADGLGLRALLDDVGARYRGAKPVPTLAANHRALAAAVAADRATGPEQDALRRYWARRLSGVPAPLLPGVDTGLAGHATHRAELDPADCVRLAAAASTAQASTYMLATTALAVALREMSGQEMFSVGAVTENRPPGTADVVGCFVNVVPVVVDLSAEPSFPAAVRRVREAVLDAWEHQALPSGEIADAAVAPRHELFRVVSETHDDHVADLHLPGCLAVSRFVPVEAERFDLSLTTTRTQDGSLVLELDHTLKALDADTGRRLLDRVHDILLAEASVA
jgi:Condensation domain/Phosphopantetheine attachment site